MQEVHGTSGTALTFAAVTVLVPGAACAVVAVLAASTQPAMAKGMAAAVSHARQEGRGLR
jgi:hypothetical protein